MCLLELCAGNAHCGGSWKLMATTQDIVEKHIGTG